MTEFGTIVVDPPWMYRSSGSHLRSTHAHRPKSFNSASNTAGSHVRYGSMSIAELKSLDIGSLAAENAHMYLWTTNSFMVEAHDLMAEWGFSQKTVLTWVKMRRDGEGASARLGYYFRGATEHAIFGVRGKQRLLTGTAVIPNVLFTPREQHHSKKPDQFYDLVERVSPGPRLDVFARTQRPGWSVWGNEVDTDVHIPNRERGD